MAERLTQKTISLLICYIKSISMFSVLLVILSLLWFLLQADHTRFNETWPFTLTCTLESVVNNTEPALGLFRLKKNEAISGAFLPTTSDFQAQLPNVLAILSSCLPYIPDSLFRIFQALWADAFLIRILESLSSSLICACRPNNFTICMFHLPPMGEMRNVYKILVGKPEETTSKTGKIKKR
jgi:hypothetical protein